MAGHEGVCERNGLPPVPGGKEVLEVCFSMRTGDWHIRTEDGWFYCRSGDVEPERRRWVPSLYGPTC